MRRWIGIILFILLFGILPHVLSRYYVILLTKILIFAIFAMSLDLLVGYLKLPSLGHGAFFGIASYFIGIFSTRVQNSFWLNFPLAIVMAVVVAAVFGLLVLRTRGAYFFMISLALSQMLWGIAFSWRFLTRGDDGIPGITRPEIVFLPWSLQDPICYLYFVLFFFIVAFVLMYILVHSPFGHTILGIRESELRMRTLGYNTWLHKYIWFIISGLFAGLAGGLSVYFNGFVSPASLSVAMSADALLMVLLGGAGTLIGPVIGAGSLVLLENIVSAYTGRWLLVLGIIFVVVRMTTPYGILGLVNRSGAKEKRKHESIGG
jgi:branched-chain amino acid transport system permease protein